MFERNKLVPLVERNIVAEVEFEQKGSCSQTSLLVNVTLRINTYVTLRPIEPEPFSECSPLLVDCPVALEECSSVAE